VRRVGTSKITKLKAKAGIVYPLIRLPKTFADEIGNVAEIFETQHNNRRALLVTFNDGIWPSEVIQPNSKVIQLLPEVIQPHCRQDLKARLCELESQIAELKSLLQKNANQKAPQSPLIHQSTQKTSGLGRIRTGDLRRVKAEVLEHAESFLHARPESSKASVGAITTKNASAPLCIV